MNNIPHDDYLDRAIQDANGRLDQLIIDLATDYPDMDRGGVFAMIAAQRALYLTASAGGAESTRKIAEDAITAFEYDQPENHIQ